MSYSLAFSKNFVVQCGLMINAVDNCLVAGVKRNFSLVGSITKSHRTRLLSSEVLAIVVQCNKIAIKCEIRVEILSRLFVFKI